MLRNRAKALISPGTDRSQIMPSLRGSVLPKGEPKMKKNVSILLVFLLLCALLSGCSRQKNAANAQPPSAVPETTTQVASASAQASAAPDIDLETGKIRLTLAGVSMQTFGWDRLAKAFNAQSEDYIVELRDYYTGDFVDDGTSVPEDMEQYRTDLDDAKTRLHTDLIVGKMPDMIVFDSLSPLTYLGKGLLLDLDPYLEADAEISSEDILCWNALHEYGGLYVMAKQFVVETLMCSQDFYDAHKGWTVTEYLEIEKDLRSDQQMIYYMSPEEFLTQMGRQYLTKALDLENATCDFDNPEFIGILNGALECGQYEALDYAGKPVGKRMEDGELMCCATWLDKPADVTFDRVQSGKRLAYIGWPTVDGSCGAAVRLNGDIGAFSATACPDGCWEFIKYVLQHGANEMDWGSPVYAPLMYEQVAQRNQTAGKYTTATDEDVQAYIAAVKTCSAMSYRDESVMQIIAEESAPLLRGEGTAEDAARRIQSRASLYIVEQYD